MDDCLRSVSTEAKAKEQINGLRQACGKGGFRLTKFICNRRSVLESIPEEKQSKDVKTLDLNYDDLPIERALGVQWCVESDTFKFRITVKDKPVTRRGILPIVSSIYDPPRIRCTIHSNSKEIASRPAEKKGLVGTTNFPTLTACAGKSGETNYHCSST